MSPPDFTPLRTGGPQCPSDLALDRLHAGELSAPEAQRLGQHVEGCAACGARMAERRAGFDALDGVDPRALLGRIRTGLDAPIPRPAGWSRLVRWLTPLALVAASALLVVRVLPGEAPLAGTRMKGSPALHVFRLQGDHAEEVLSGSAFAPGNRLRFVVDLPTEGYVKVLGVESSGTLYTAWPLDSGVQTRLDTGQGIELPGAVALDANTGRETLYLVHCPLEAGPPACTAGGAEGRPQCPKGCALTSFLMDKGS